MLTCVVAVQNQRPSLQTNRESTTKQEVSNTSISQKYCEPVLYLPESSEGTRAMAGNSPTSPLPGVTRGGVKQAAPLGSLGSITIHSPIGAGMGVRRKGRDQESLGVPREG